MIFERLDTIRGIRFKGRYVCMKEFHRECDVSVVIPCYRCSDTLGRALASVAAQSLLPAEVILVDDASGDETEQVMDSLVAEYSQGWVKTVHLPVNGGPSAARNAGWERSTCSYVAFLDADDTWHPDKIRTQFGYMQTHPLIELTGHGWSLSVGKETVSAGGYEAKPILPARLLFSNRLQIGTVMLRREIPVRFDTELRYSEDYLFCLRVLYRGYRGMFINRPLLFKHKAPYGEGGLSAHLWLMELGELETYRRLWKEEHVPGLLVSPLVLWSFVRFVRRILVSLCRRSARRDDD